MIDQEALGHLIAARVVEMLEPVIRRMVWDAIEENMNGAKRNTTETEPQKQLGANQKLFIDAIKKLSSDFEDVRIKELKDFLKMDRRRWFDALKTLIDRGIVEVNGKFVRLREM